MLLTGVTTNELELALDGAVTIGTKVEDEEGPATDGGGGGACFNAAFVLTLLGGIVSCCCLYGDGAGATGSP